MKVKMSAQSMDLAAYEGEGVPFSPDIA